jgi:multidrug efflux pump subunit AcrB
MLLAYLLMVVNFQSWTQPFIIITALPFALTGIIWILFVTETTLSVPALMGAIMCTGVATANSVLVVTFANELLEKYKDPYRAALVHRLAYNDDIVAFKMGRRQGARRAHV